MRIGACAEHVRLVMFRLHGTAVSLQPTVLCLLVPLVAHCFLSCMQGQGGAELDDSIKKYRQSIFKLNYKLKKTKLNRKACHRIVVPQNAAERVLADQKQDSNRIANL